MTGNLYDIDELPGKPMVKTKRELKYQEQADTMRANPGKYVTIDTFDSESKAKTCRNCILGVSYAAFKPMYQCMDAQVRELSEHEYAVYAAYMPGVKGR